MVLLMWKDVEEIDGLGRVEAKHVLDCQVYFFGVCGRVDKEVTATVCAVLFVGDGKEVVGLGVADDL